MSLVKWESNRLVLASNTLKVQSLKVTFSPLWTSQWMVPKWGLKEHLWIPVPSCFICLYYFVYRTHLTLFKMTLQTQSETKRLVTWSQWQLQHLFKTGDLLAVPQPVVPGFKAWDQWRYRTLNTPSRSVVKAVLHTPLCLFPVMLICSHVLFSSAGFLLLPFRTPGILSKSPKDLSILSHILGSLGDLREVWGILVV